MSLFRASSVCLFVHFPPTFHIVHLHFFKTFVVQSIAVLATGFCFQLCPFPAPGMFRIAPFPFSPRPTVDKNELYIIKIKIHSSCEVQYFVETHLCKLCVILRSRVLRVVCPHITYVPLGSVPYLHPSFCAYAQAYEMMVTDSH